MQPIDAATLLAAGRETRAIVTVEDHYSAGGLGDAVDEVVSPKGVKVHRLAVRELARSATPEQLIDLCGLSAAKIVAAIKAL